MSKHNKNEQSEGGRGGPSSREDICLSPPPYEQPELQLSGSFEQTLRNNRFPVDPCEPVTLMKNSIRTVRDDIRLFSVSSTRAPGSFTGRNLIVLARCADGYPMSRIRFHDVTSDDIDITVNNHSTKLKEDGTFSTRWYYRPTTPIGSPKMWWYDEGDDLLLATAKKGDAGHHIVAKLIGAFLVWEQGGWPVEVVEEVLTTAIAMMEVTERLVGVDNEVLGGVVEIAAMGAGI